MSAPCGRYTRTRVPMPGSAVDEDASAPAREDAVDDGKPEPAALVARPRREERLEDAREIGRRDAGPVVLDLDDREDAGPHGQEHSFRRRVERRRRRRGSRSARSAATASAAFATSSRSTASRSDGATSAFPSARSQARVRSGPARRVSVSRRLEHDVEGPHLSAGSRIRRPLALRSRSARPDVRRAASVTASRFSRTAGARPASSSASSARPITTVIRLLMTCAMPLASRPISSIFSAARRRSSAASSRRSRRFSAVRPDEAHEEEEREDDESRPRAAGAPGRSGRRAARIRSVPTPSTATIGSGLNALRLSGRSGASRSGCGSSRKDAPA